MYENVCIELKDLEVKHDFQSNLLTSKLDSETALKQEILQLKSRSESLLSHIKQSLNSSKGFEILENTVTNLSLAFISKNEKELSQKQIQLLRDLFDHSQIKAINSMKEKLIGLETDNHLATTVIKRQTDIGKQVIKLAKKYAYAIKDWVEWYNLIKVPIQKLIVQSDQLECFNDHAAKILQEFKDEIYNNIFQISEFSIQINNDLLEVTRHSRYNALEGYSDLCVSQISKSINSDELSSERKDYLSKSSSNRNVFNLNIRNWLTI